MSNFYDTIPEGKLTPVQTRAILAYEGITAPTENKPIVVNDGKAKLHRWCGFFLLEKFSKDPLVKALEIFKPAAERANKMLQLVASNPSEIVGLAKELQACLYLRVLGDGSIDFEDLLNQFLRVLLDGSQIEWCICRSLGKLPTAVLTELEGDQI